MAKNDLKQKAIALREKGTSYSDIKKKIPVSKSTLSLWLRDMPLSKERIGELRDRNPKRIERYRETMRLKRKARIDEVFTIVAERIKTIEERDLLIGGIFLYMGEGSKTTKGTTALTNTNPDILTLFIKWLYLHDVPASKIKVQLHLYENMDSKKQILFWSTYLGIDKKQFRKPHIKPVHSDSISYKNKFGQGTCTVLFENVSMYEMTMMYIKYIQELYKPALQQL